jgi:hypothetical protein
VYHNTYDPILKKSKEAYNQDLSQSVGDIELSAADEESMNPLSIVPVRGDYEVNRGAPIPSVDG